MLQDEGDRAMDFRQRSDGWVGVKDRLGGSPIPKVVDHNVKANARSSDVLPAVYESRRIR
jgi:hypothetical protein